VAAFPNGKAERLPDTAVISRNGHPVSGASQPCASDPDVIAACFTVHGRLSLYNGAWTARIWRIGTKRLLGVDDDFPLPWFGAKHVDWGTDVYGDFEVCPFVAEKPGAMQIVCVENGSNLVVKRP